MQVFNSLKAGSKHLERYGLGEKKRDNLESRTLSQMFRRGKFTFQRAISKFISDHYIPLGLVLNLDQIPLSNVSSGSLSRVSTTIDK